jgi:hypothetical protein
MHLEAQQVDQEPSPSLSSPRSPCRQVTVTGPSPQAPALCDSVLFLPWERSTRSWRNGTITALHVTGDKYVTYHRHLRFALFLPMLSRSLGQLCAPIIFLHTSMCVIQFLCPSDILACPWSSPPHPVSPVFSLLVKGLYWPNGCSL